MRKAWDVVRNSMDINSNFFKVIGIIADFLAIVTVIAAIPFALLKKNERLLAFKISMFLHYMVRLAASIIVGLFIFQLAKLVYGIVLLPLQGSIDYDNFIWKDGFEIEHITAYFLSGVFGVILCWILFTFIWTSSWNMSKEFFNLFLPKSKLLVKDKPPLEILSALYWTAEKHVDVTGTATKMIVDNKLTIKAANELFGDPNPGVAKVLIINYRIGKRTSEVRVGEGETISIP